MSATVVQGVRGTTILGTETRRTRDVTSLMARLEPDAGPLTTILNRLRKRPATDPKFEWFEDELLPRFDTLGGSLTAGASSMTVTNYKFFRKGDLVRVNKGEIVRVTATPTSTTVSISRAFGETAAASASSGNQLHILSNAQAEGAALPSLISTQKVPVYNYTQIFRRVWGVTRTQEGTTQFAGQDRPSLRRDNMIEHKKDIEQGILFGERYEDTTTETHPVRATRGAIRFIQTNVKNVATLTEQEFEDFLRPPYRYGSKSKVLFGSPKLMQVINGFSRSKLQTMTKDESYGVTMTRYHNSGRNVMLVEHNLLTNDSLTDLTGFAGYGVLLDLEDLELRYMKGRMTVVNENVQNPGDDQVLDEVLSEVGLEMHQERKHALLTGVIE